MRWPRRGIGSRLYGMRPLLRIRAARRLVVAGVAMGLLAATFVEAPAQAHILQDRLTLHLYRASIDPDRFDFSSERTPPAAGEMQLRDYFHRAALDSNAALSIYNARYYGFRRYELTRPQSALRGAELGTSLGMFLGAVGNTLGFIGDDSVWYLMGAAAAAGAVWGGAVKHDEPGWRVRYRWEP